MHTHSHILPEAACIIRRVNNLINNNQQQVAQPLRVCEEYISIAESFGFEASSPLVLLSHTLLNHDDWIRKYEKNVGVIADKLISVIIRLYLHMFNSNFVFTLFLFNKARV